MERAEQPVVRARRALRGSAIVIVDDLSPFYNSIFHELREKAGKNVWSSGGQLFVKIRGEVHKVDARNKHETLSQLDQVSVRGDSPPSNLRGFGRGRGKGDASPAL